MWPLLACCCPVACMVTIVVAPVAGDAHDTSCVLNAPQKQAAAGLKLPKEREAPQPSWLQQFTAPKVPATVSRGYTPAALGWVMHCQLRCASSLPNARCCVGEYTGKLCWVLTSLSNLCSAGGAGARCRRGPGPCSTRAAAATAAAQGGRAQTRGAQA